MKKPLVSRIFGLAALYCAVFFVLVIVQFSKKGNFTLASGAMTVKGRYLESAQADVESDGQAVTGGIKIFFGGLEFNLKNDNGKGLFLTGMHGEIAVNPDYIIVEDNKTTIGLPGGSAIVFLSLDSARGPELQISASLAENILEASVSISPRRSSLVRENGADAPGQLGILYNGLRFLFSGQGAELENKKIVLSRENSLIAYRSRGKQKEFDTADYTIAKAENYDSSVMQWRDSSYAYWSQHASALQSDNDIAAYCSEALRKGQYAQAIRAIPGDFKSGPRNSHISSGFTGGMAQAYNSFSSEEKEKSSRINRLTKEKSPDVFNEEHFLEFLMVRGNTALANEVIELVKNTEKEALAVEHCSGLLEFYADMKRWRPAMENPVEPLIDQILLLISENLARDNEKDLVLVTYPGKSGLSGLRLGKALVYWADNAKNPGWAAVGRSLVLSALAGGGDASEGELYNALKPSDYYARASLLADNGLWTWTVSPSARASYTDGNLNISCSFPANMTHHVIICGVRPFIKLQVHDMDWRSDSQFETYDSTGWVYYQRDQVLILKLKHRVTTENIKIFYRVEAPPPVIIEEIPADTESNGGDDIDS